MRIFPSHPHSRLWNVFRGVVVAWRASGSIIRKERQKYVVRCPKTFPHRTKVQSKYNANALNFRKKNIAAEPTYIFLIVSIKSYIIEFELCHEINKNILNGWNGDPNKAYNDVYYTSGEHKITVGYFYLSPTIIFEALSEGWTIMSGHPEAVRE